MPATPPLPPPLTESFPFHSLRWIFTYVSFVLIVLLIPFNFSLFIFRSVFLNCFVSSWIISFIIHQQTRKENNSFF